jgi:hypothetical protein
VVSDEVSQYGKLTKATKKEIDREWTRINANKELKRQIKDDLHLSAAPTTVARIQ